MVTPSFWKNRKVYVTGHTGFKGAWLCAWLDELGAQVSALALEPEGEPNLFKTLRIDARINDHQVGDIRHQEVLDEQLSRNQPEIIFHLAAQPLVRRSYREPDLTFETNVMGSLRVLEAARRCPSIRAVVFVTSDKCYANQEWSFGYRETDPMGGHDPYSASKGAAELLVQSYRSAFFIPEGRVQVASVRAGNVIGGGDWAEDRIVPDCIKALTNHEPISIRNPLARRPWQHVLEPLGGYLLVAEKLLQSDAADFAKGWNFGPPLTSNRPVQDLVDCLIQSWGSGSYQTPEDVAKVHEATLLHLNCDQAGHQLNWHPQLSFEETIDWTSQWYQRWSQGADMIDHTRQQIQTYQKMICKDESR